MDNYTLGWFFAILQRRAGMKPGSEAYRLATRGLARHARNIIAGEY